MNDAAIAELRGASASIASDPRILGVLGSALAAAGKDNEAEEVLRELRGQTATRYVPPYYIALVCAALGQGDLAFESLHQASEDRALDMRFLRVDPALDSLRSDPRFDALLRKINVGS
jgi:hypothetical protein